MVCRVWHPARGGDEVVAFHVCRNVSMAMSIRKSEACGNMGVFPKNDRRALWINSTINMSF